MIMKDIPCIVLSLFLFVSGCAPVISKELRTKVAREITLRELLQDPDLHKGKLVLWGGVIIGAKNVKQGTLIEVLQKPTDRRGRPRDVDQSDGRFMALYEGYLDPAIYSQGREVTVAGEVKGKRVLPLGEIEYAYPLISIKELYLWPPKVKERFYPYPYWHYPWWYDPYWGPW
jgi:outer membrane lipoprotein